MSVFGLLALVMGVDEFYYHHKRGLPRWERIGHPVDTLTVILPLTLAVRMPPCPQSITIYAGLALFSCLVVTKDEFIHARFCSASEHWIHAVLFILHPMIFMSVYLLWNGLAGAPVLLLPTLLVMTIGYFFYQVVYWNMLAPPVATDKTPINNSFYDLLGERWLNGDNNPVALLRSESRLKNPWVERTITERFGPKPVKILDIGCGGGFLSNWLAAAGHAVTGVDLSEPSLDIARRSDGTGKAVYRNASAYELPFPDQAFDAVCVMDFLEHVDDPGRVVKEAARVLKTGGILFFHTFNRSWVSWLIAIQGVRWFVRNTPEHMHVLHLFIKPEELVGFCTANDLEVLDLRGSRPKVNGAFLQLLLTRRVSDKFEFVFSRSTPVGYLGYARKRG